MSAELKRLGKPAKLTAWGEYPTLPNKNNTLYDHRWRLVAHDEIHNARKAGRGLYHGERLLSTLASFAVGMTATPIMTEATDAIAIARIIGFADFNGEDTKDDVQAFIRDVASMRRRQLVERREKDDANTILNSLEDEAQPAEPDGTVWDVAKLSRKLGTKFARIIIRRTHQSVTTAPGGSDMQKLEPCTVVMCALVMGPKEASLHHRAVVKAREAKMQYDLEHENDSHRIPSTDFYVPFRQRSTHPLAAAPDDDPVRAVFPESKAAYAHNPSAKLDALIHLCTAHQADRQLPPQVYTDAGEWQDGPWTPPLTGDARARDDNKKQKIVVYSYFSHNSALIQRVMLEFGRVLYRANRSSADSGGARRAERHDA